MTGRVRGLLGEHGPVVLTGLGVVLVVALVARLGVVGVALVFMLVNAGWLAWIGWWSVTRGRRQPLGDPGRFVRAPGDAAGDGSTEGTGSSEGGGG